MKVLLNKVTTNKVNFRGINDTVNRIKQQIQNGGALMGDTFTKADETSTVIIENYYESGKESSNITPQSSNKSGAAVEGAVSGTTTGSAIEGTKSVAEKIKGNKTDINQKVDNIDGDDCSNIDLNDETDGLENLENIDNVDDINSEIIEISDVDSEVDIDPDIDFDVDAGDIEVDLGDIF